MINQNCPKGGEHEWNNELESKYCLNCDTSGDYVLGFEDGRQAERKRIKEIIDNNVRKQINNKEQNIYLDLLEALSKGDD